MSSSPAVLEFESTRALRGGGTAIPPPLTTTNESSGLSQAIQQSPNSGVPGSSLNRAGMTGVRFLSYELGAKIGAGGMGTVHCATHIWLGRTVAIKFIAPQVLDCPEAVNRFRHEALAIGALDHPNIVRATDAGEFDGVHFLVTEFIDGEELTSLVRRLGRLEIADACEAIRQAALGLAHAHQRGLVHRDVKPSNLLLDRSGTIKLLDFGLARMAAGQTTLTSTGQVIGTLDFLAPEQAKDARNVDPRGDQYSLGCTLYFLLTGGPPFDGPAYDTAASKLKAHLTDRPRPVSELRRRVPLALVACLDRMLAKLPNDRFDSLANVADALAPFCKGACLTALAGNEDAASARRDPTAPPHYSACGELAERFAAVFGWALRGAFCRTEPSTAAPVRRQPLLSISGIVLLAFFGFVLSHFSCVEIKEEPASGAHGGGEKAEVIEFGFGQQPALPEFSQPGRK
jgi:serine/threonine protein kinase